MHHIKDNIDKKFIKSVFFTIKLLDSLRGYSFEWFFLIEVFDNKIILNYKLYFPSGHWNLWAM